MTPIQTPSACSSYPIALATAREQVMFHSRHRDHWIELQLLSQGVLIALALGVKIGTVRTDESIPDALLFSVPISLIFCALYVVEDRLVAQFCGYISSVSEHVKELCQGNITIENPEAHLRNSIFSLDFLTVRLIAQIVTFLLIPGSIAIYAFFDIHAWHLREIGLAILSVISWFTAIALLGQAFLRHRSYDRKLLSEEIG